MQTVCQQLVAAPRASVACSRRSSLCIAAASHSSFAGQPLAALPTRGRRSVRAFRVSAAKKVEKSSPLDDIDVSEILTETAEKIGTAWEETEDKPAVVTLLAFGFVGLFATAGILKGIESLPLAATFFQLVGIAFSGWFTYRYLLFKPDREELKRSIAELKQKILQ